MRLQARKHVKNGSKWIASLLDWERGSPHTGMGSGCEQLAGHSPGRMH